RWAVPSATALAATPEELRALRAAVKGAALPLATTPDVAGSVPLLLSAPLPAEFGAPALRAAFATWVLGALPVSRTADGGHHSCCECRSIIWLWSARYMCVPCDKMLCESCARGEHRRRLPEMGYD